MLIEWVLALVCYAGAGCDEPTVTLSPAAASVAACESGDTVRLGTLDWDAVNVNADGTRDYGAFQFNDYWVWSDADRWFMNQLATLFCCVVVLVVFVMTVGGMVAKYWSDDDD